MIEAKNITKVFSVINPQGLAEEITAIHSVSLKVEEGEFVAIVGHSGCGKSTFLEILAGLQAPTKGEVYINNKLLSPIGSNLWQDSKLDITMVFQDYAIFPWMTVLENVLFTLKLHGVPKEERGDLARKYLNLVGLNGAENKYPSQLSGGMRQRVALARTLSVEPKVILMDEPFGAVDAFTRKKLNEDLLNIWQNMQQTIILVTHNINEALYLADRVVAFSSQPGTVRDIIPVNIPRPRKQNEIEELSEKIWQIYAVK